MFCNECGAAMSDGSKFCQNCGTGVVVRPSSSEARLSPSTVGSAAPLITRSNLPNTPARRIGAVVAGVALFFAMLFVFENVFVWLLGRKFATMEMITPWLVLNYFAARGMTGVAGEAASRIAKDFSSVVFGRSIATLLAIGAVGMLISAIFVESSTLRMIGLMFAGMYAACLAGVTTQCPIKLPAAPSLRTAA